ncbi:hypothetical protein Dda_2763 [Drechslerella dactyloides]|uniref:Uncharacterized protein n=1 Tax=Drechslerella dactyloides TaxID=74499 RepID=A0AAD6J1M0_DREDA|nr:hypothetical protein Dda_2763 [Drechslerella dactyloides]
MSDFSDPILTSGPSASDAPDTLPPDAGTDDAEEPSPEEVRKVLVATKAHLQEKLQTMKDRGNAPEAIIKMLEEQVKDAGRRIAMPDPRKTPPLIKEPPL